MSYQWSDLRDPKKYDLERMLKLIPMLDFLKGDFHGISEITRESVRRGIIREDERDSLFVTFKRINNRINMFEATFYPSDQSYTGRDRYEFRLMNLTPDDFRCRIEEYNSRHFKSPLQS